MAKVVFDPVEFRDLYPQFTAELLTDGQLRQAFDVACLLLDNSPSSPVPYEPEKDVMTRQVLLYMLVCHICALALWGREGQAGPVASAAEGTVNVSFAVPQSPDGRYYNQTPCGQSFWAATAKYRIGGIYVDKVDHAHPWG